MSFLEKIPASRIQAVLAVGLSVLFYTLSMPGPDCAALAWVWAAPMALWAATRPAWKTWLIGAALGSWLSGVITLVWLRHVYPPLGWFAVLALPLAYSVFPFLWLVALRMIFPESGKGRAFVARLLNLLGLAGLWVFLEWVLTWIFTGFPWMPLGATQWQRPAMLAYSPWAGTAGVSFLIIFFNLGVARYARLLTVESRLKAGVPVGDSQSMFRSLRFICPEFYCALIPVMLSVFVYWNHCLDFAKNQEKYFSFAAVQTDLNPQEKWSSDRLSDSLGMLEKLTLDAAADTPSPDFIVWPEATLPVPLDTQWYREWLEGLSASSGKLIVMGGINPGSQPDTYYNSVHCVYPKSGIADAFFAKRHLVPFGEYLPFADYLPLRKIVPIASDCLVGTSAAPLPIYLKSGSYSMGVLVCYEDVFPELGRDLVRNGADFLAVVTNDAWYGEEAGAYQHAAHSVMQAVNLGVPVIRCGNAGWSGYINPLGHMAVMTDNGKEDGTIYFRGQETFVVNGWRRFDDYGNATGVGGRTFYARHGNWLVTVGGLLFLSAYVRNRRWKRGTNKG